MLEVAKDVYMLRGFPAHAINVYLVGNVLVDAATRWASRRILRQIKGHAITAHVITHAHADHQGASHAVCTQLNIPLWCGTADADAMEQGNLSNLIPQNWLTRILENVWQGPAHAVARRLHEGDLVADFTVLEVPGHSPGQIALWREHDRVLLLGDVLVNMNFLTTAEQLGEPPGVFTLDQDQNRRSIRKLAALKPQVICFGHGRPLTDAQRFQAFVDQLPTFC